MRTSASLLLAVSVIPAILSACGGDGTGAAGGGGEAATSSSASSSHASSGHGASSSDASTSSAGGGSSSGGASSSGGSSSGGGGGGDGGAGGSSDGGGGGVSSSRGFPVGSPWVSFYGSVSGLDLDKMASAFRVINLDADPDAANVTPTQITHLKAGGSNRVISYLDIGSCEKYRSYYQTAPAGHASCVSSGALTTIYQGYPDEKWADLSNVAYRDLMVNYVAQRLVDRGVDGFFLDNMEVVEHGANSNNGPCDAACSQGGLDLVYELRQRFPDKLIVMQNATSATTRLGTTHGVAYPSLLDGISHEEVYSAGGDQQAQNQLQAWLALGLMVNGYPLWVAAEDYVGACNANHKTAADALYAQALTDNVNEYVTDDSGMQLGPCYWSDF